MNDRLKQRISDLERALDRLSEAMSEEPSSNRLVIDARIQRFEFTFELFWKTLQLILGDKGQRATFPKEVLKKAYQAHWIDDEELWLGMLDDRNLSSHTYKEALADEIYERIKRYVPELKRAFHTLQTVAGE